MREDNKWDEHTEAFRFLRKLCDGFVVISFIYLLVSSILGYWAMKTEESFFGGIGESIGIYSCVE